MKVTNSLVALAVVACVSAQTPGNFSVISTLPLIVIGEPANVTLSPGQLVPQSDVLYSPSIILANSSDTNYVAFMIDPTVSAGTFLHWFQPNLVADDNGNLTFDATTTNASSAVGAGYIYPQPPSDGYAHQYVVLLYEQPSNWAVPSNYSTINPPASSQARQGFDMADFQHASGLDAPIGTNFFRVLNGTAELTSSLATATATGSGAPATQSGATATGSATGSAASASASATATGNVAAVNLLDNVAKVGWVGALALPFLAF